MSRWKNGANAFRAFLLAVAAFSQPALGHAASAEMTFRPVVVSGRAGVSAVGRITGSTPGAFVASGYFHQRRLVFIESPGGSVDAAMRLGRLFRQSGVTVVVAGLVPDGSGSESMIGGQCFSACVYAIMGAVHRVVPEVSKVGIHEMAPVDGMPDEPLARAEIDDEHVEMRALLAAYARRMGIGSGLIDAAERTSPGSLRILSQDEMRRWRLAVPHL